MGWCWGGIVFGVENERGSGSREECVDNAPQRTATSCILLGGTLRGLAACTKIGGPSYVPDISPLVCYARRNARAEHGGISSTRRPRDISSSGTAKGTTTLKTSG
jgi:hypothetical protein